MYKIISPLLAFPALLPLVACSSAGNDEPPLIIDPVDPVHRTVLVYMVAKNNLHSDIYPEEDYDHLDIKEMQQAAAAGGLNGGRLIVYHSSGNEAPKLIEITPDGSQEILRTYPASSVSVSASQMEQVLDDTQLLAPASDYGIVLWSHGSGWLEDGIEQLPLTRSFGLEGSSSTMNISVMADVLRNRDLSFIYFDCCFMASIEVFYELRECAPYIVASASELPVYGMDYAANIPCFLTSGEPDLKQAVKNTFDSYDRREGEWRTCTISLVETSTLDNVAAAARNLYSDISIPYNITSVPQRFLRGTNYYYDLSDYVNKIEKVDASKADALSDAVDNAVICKYNTPSLWPGTQFDEVKINTHCGMSTYIVRSAGDADKKGYRNLKWYKDVVSVMLNNSL